MAAIEGFLLSPQQQRLWRLSQASGAYVCHSVLELHGELDAGRLERALATVVARHEILRTTFPVPPSLTTPLQVIAESAAVAPLSATPVREEPLDLTRGPLLSARLVERGERHCALLVSLPALCADARSLGNLTAELARAYAGGELAPVAMQYADYAAWLHEQLADAGAAAGRTYWQKYDLAALAALRLPGERGQEAAFAPAAETAVWPAERWRAIESAARSGGVSPAAWLLAAWHGLLSRLAGPPPADDAAPLTVGVLCAGREFAELRDAVGPYARYLPVAPRAAGGGEVALGERAAELQRAWEAGREWQDAFSWASDAAAGGADFFPVCFDFAELPPAEHGPDLELRVSRMEVCLDRFKVRLGCRVTGEELRVELAYDTACIERVAAARLAEQLRVLVEGALGAPVAPLGALPLLSPAARHQLLWGWNDTPAPGALAAASVPELFARQATATPRAVALEHEGRTLTYAELAARAATLAGALGAEGVGPEVVVGLYLERSPELVIALLAVLAAGGAYLPLDPELPGERVAFMLADSGAALVLTRGDLAAALP